MCEQQHVEGSAPSHTFLLGNECVERKECELIVNNDSEEFGLFNNKDESTI